MAKFIDRLNLLTTASKEVESIKANIQDRLNSLLPNRVKSKANIFELILQVSTDILIIIRDYINNAIRENNVLIAENPLSVRGLAQLSGHTATRAISARGLVSIQQSKTGLNSVGTYFLFGENTSFVCRANGLVYVLQSVLPIKFDSSTNKRYFNLIEGIRKTQRFVADGTNLYTVRLDEVEKIEHYDIRIFVDSIQYTKVDSLHSMKKGTYLLRNGIGNQIDIVFGNETNNNKLREGANVEIKYLTTSGEYGNVEIGSIFDIVSGIYIADGIEVDINEYLTITVENGFDLGSNGESIETTRLLTGYSSRSLTFPKPDNLKAYLSRLSVLSHVDAWRSETDNKVFNLVCFPKITLLSLKDYFYLPLEKFKLSDKLKTSILAMIEASRRQLVSDEFIFRDVEVKKYAMLVYIDCTIYSEKEFKDNVLSAIAGYMVNDSFSVNSGIISLSGFENLLYDMDEVNRVKIDLFSEHNEVARLSGEYGYENPNIGFSDMSDIVTKENEIPIIRGGFSSYSGFEFNSEGVHIFIKKNEQWQQI